MPADRRQNSFRKILKVDGLEDRVTPTALVTGHWSGKFDVPGGRPYQHYSIGFNLQPGVGSAVFGTEHVSVRGMPQFYENRTVSGNISYGNQLHLTAGAITSEAGTFWPDNTADFAIPDVFPSGVVHGTFVSYPNGLFGFGYEYDMDVAHISGPPTTPPPLQVTTSTGQSSFPISNVPGMPTIGADVSEIGANTDLSGITFNWKAQLVFNGTETPGGQAESTLTVLKTTVGAHVNFLPQNWGRLQGGELTLTANAVVNGEHVTITLGNLTIPGINPSVSQLEAALGSDVLRQIAHQESNFQQFGADGWPLFNTGTPSTVGVMQVKSTLANAWNWKSNVAAGKVKLAAAQTGAVNFVSALRISPDYIKLIKATNANLVAQGLPKVQISIPQLTADQLLRDTIRGYDGWYGSYLNSTHLKLHELRLQLDANGLLQLQATSNPHNYLATWEIVPPSDRPLGQGDSNFVNDVLAQTP